MSTSDMREEPRRLKRPTPVLERMPFAWFLEYGVDGCDKDPETPVARAFRTVFREGKPIGSFQLCYFEDTLHVRRWLGVLVQSAGDRIIFYPGFRVLVERLHGADAPFEFDHISLEKDRRHWHFSLFDVDDHRWGGLTSPLGDNCHAWFGLSVADPMLMRPVRQVVLIEVQAPKSDMERRFSLWGDARKRSGERILGLGDIPASDDWFLHFSFIVGPKGFEHRKGNKAFMIYSQLPIENGPEPGASIVARTHKLELSDDTDLQIVVATIPGRLKSPFFLTTRIPRELRGAPRQGP